MTADRLSLRRTRALALWNQLRAADEVTSPAVERALRRKLLDLPPRIDKQALAERVLNNGAVLHKHEREFIADWLKGRKKPRHRPRSADTIIKAYEIAQFVFYYEAIYPNDLRKEIDDKVKALYGVAPRTVRDFIEKLDPERKRHMMTSAAIFAAMLDEAVAVKSPLHRR